VLEQAANLLPWMASRTKGGWWILMFWNQANWPKIIPKKKWANKKA